MSTIVDLRGRVKAALGITGTSTEPGYEDHNLDQHIKQAVEELSVHLPVEAQTDLTLSAGSRALSVGGLTRLLRVAAVELPVGRWPRALVDFDRWENTLTLDVAPPGSAVTARVYYEQAHLVDAAGSTVEPEHEHLITDGAAAFAVLARATAAANIWVGSTAPQPQTYQHLRIAQTRLARWRTELRRLGGQLGRRRFYVPAGGPSPRSVVTEG